MTHAELLKLDGKKITCKISGTEIDDAEIAVEDEMVYVLQDKEGGFNADNKRGYKYSWCISIKDNKYENDSHTCTNIELKHRKIEDGLKEGDIIVYSFGEKLVLGVCGRVIFTSYLDDFDTASDNNYTLKELIELGYKLKDQVEVETLEIGGKKYDKNEVEKRLKDLKAVN